MNLTELRTEFDRLKPRYKQLNENLRCKLTDLLKDQKIEFVAIEARVKGFNSFIDKIKRDRNKYKNPLIDITDICGLRIICSYPSDLEDIQSIIKKEFEVIKTSNKVDEMDDDEFGYRSNHYIARIKKSWVDKPQYRDLGDLKFEIQTRSILMHGWAVISRSLAYNQKRDVPREFLRPLNGLSALLEIADQQFERMKSKKKEYSKRFVEETGMPEFLPQDTLNADSLQALLDYYFPNRERSPEISSLLGQIRGLKMELADYNLAVKSVIPFLDQIENDFHPPKPWGQVWAAQLVLTLTNDTYFSIDMENAGPDSEFIEITSKWRTKIGQQQTNPA